MIDGDWRLVYPGVDYTFGAPGRTVVNRTTPEYGDYGIVSTDGQRARADGVDFGVDYFGGRTITFDLAAFGATETANRDAVQELARVWRADRVRQSAGAVAELHSQYRGIQRVVFGRPRRFTPNMGGARTQRMSTVAADFACTDATFYSSFVNEQAISLVPGVQGGIVAPLVAPISTTATSDRSVQMNVVSDLPVWPVITIPGPITIPYLEVVGLWNFGLSVEVPYDGTLIIDTQPWARTILLNGQSVAGRVGRNVPRLQNLAIPPGQYELILRGISATNNVTARIQWRSAYSTP